MKKKKNFADSSAHCESLGGSLAVPESAEENELMLQELGECWQVFIPPLLFPLLRNQANVFELTLQLAQLVYFAF